MPSTITTTSLNISEPNGTTPTTGAVRANFGVTKTGLDTAASEITALQSGLASLITRVTALESAGPPPAQVPVINSPATDTATVGTSYTYQITATNHPLTGYGATGLPSHGLSFTAGTGVISGTPTTDGTVSSNITASNAAGTSTVLGLTITIAPATGTTGWQVTHSFPGNLASFTRTTGGSILLTSWTGWQPAYAADVNDSLYDALTPAAVPVKLYATYSGQSEVLVDFDNWPGTAGDNKITDWGYHAGTNSIYIRGVNTTGNPIALRLVRE